MSGKRIFLADTVFYFFFSWKSKRVRGDSEKEEVMYIQSSAVSMNSRRTYFEQNVRSASAAFGRFIIKPASTNANESVDGETSSSQNSFSDTLFDLKNRFQESQSVRASRLQDKMQTLDKMRSQMMDYLLYILFGKEVPAENTADLSEDTGGEITQTADNSYLIGVGNTAMSQRQYVTSYYHTERETTALDARASVVTADGRTINLNLTMELSRSFTEATQEMINYSQPVLCDPLVININSPSAHVSDQKFFFDLDADGTEEEISMADQGSGFLALDKNGDGIINNGSELFGAATGNGFEELRTYDSDGNGWIDEADEIFKHLKIWTKDANGNDVLCGLGKAGVGAIYLGSSPTEFSLKEAAANETNAIIRRTGIFLYENGNAGTIQQVDLAK